MSRSRTILLAALSVTALGLSACDLEEPGMDPGTEDDGADQEAPEEGMDLEPDMGEEPDEGTQEGSG